MPVILQRPVSQPCPPKASERTAAYYLPLTEESAARFTGDWTGLVLSQLARFRLPSDLAEDAAQETLLRALRALPKFRGESKLSTWIYSIAWREGHRAWQRLDRLKKREVSCKAIPEPTAPAATDNLAQADELARVQAALDQIPVKQRLALGYHYLEDLSVAEIADVMKVAPGTVKSWLKRGRDRLRLRLNDGAPS